MRSTCPAAFWAPTWWPAQTCWRQPSEWLAGWLACLVAGFAAGLVDGLVGGHLAGCLAGRMLVSLPLGEACGCEGRQAGGRPVAAGLHHWLTAPREPC